MLIRHKQRYLIELTHIAKSRMQQALPTCSTGGAMHDAVMQVTISGLS
ncbi:MAG: hypothetical protein JNN20_01790 [Betaproteobacteria bacterium]|nr:hypothetical protein [Betaproteobacteria bacterium]